MGRRLAGRLERWVANGVAASARGLGLMQAAVPAGPEPALRTVRASTAALQAGVLVLPEGDALAFSPPLVITEAQLDHALDVVEAALGAP
jgi:4-aminobutyrate aminotransferase-like enzyme